MLGSLDLVMAYKLDKSINLLPTLLPNVQIYLLFPCAASLPDSRNYTKTSVQKPHFLNSLKLVAYRSPRSCESHCHSFVSLDTIK